MNISLFYPLLFITFFSNHNHLNTAAIFSVDVELTHLFSNKHKYTALSNKHNVSLEVGPFFHSQVKGNACKWGEKEQNVV